LFPGGRMNPKQMQAAMRRMGVSQEEVQDVEEVVIKTRSKEIVFKEAAVMKITMQGQITFQVVGNPEERERKTVEASGEDGVPDEDVQLVVSQTGCTASEAKKALEECDGAPAEAILKIMTPS
jgi:nascent polypeptide-associated complex subunit alpha